MRGKGDNEGAEDADAPRKPRDMKVNHPQPMFRYVNRADQSLLAVPLGPPFVPAANTANVTEEEGLYDATLRRAFGMSNIREALPHAEAGKRHHLVDDVLAYHRRAPIKTVATHHRVVLFCLSHPCDATKPDPRQQLVARNGLCALSWRRRFAQECQVLETHLRGDETCMQCVAQHKGAEQVCASAVQREGRRPSLLSWRRRAICAGPRTAVWHSCAEPKVDVGMVDVLGLRMPYQGPWTKQVR